MGARVGSFGDQGMYSGSWLDLVMNPLGTPLEGSRKFDNLKGTVLEPRSLRVETNANK